MNKQQIIDYIISLKAPKRGFYLQSGFDQKTLMSSAFSIINLELINGMETINKEIESNYFLSSQDQKTGLFIDSSWKGNISNIKDLEKNYIPYQTTAFSISALDALGYQPKYGFHFLDYFRNKTNLKDWFFGLNWKNPWNESNKVMFLLQFFSHEDIRFNNLESKSLVLLLLDLLDASIDHQTGYWGTDKGASNFNGMAGAFHFYNHYKYYVRHIPYEQPALINTIKIQEKDGLFHPLGGGGACEDLDAIDIICKLNINDRQKMEVLKKAYYSILDLHRDDGGFPWAIRPVFPFLYGLQYLNPLNNQFHFGMFKWILKRNIIGSLIPSLKENRLYQYSGWDQMKYNIDESDGWSTWFRLLSLATIEQLIPSIKNHDIDFNFRSLPALGWQNV